VRGFGKYRRELAKERTDKEAPKRETASTREKPSTQQSKENTAIQRKGNN
jgi:hypothetical protein